MGAADHLRYRDRYPDFDALAAQHTEHVDYRVTRVWRPATCVAVVAPHGGSIERRTSAIATALAGAEFSYYLFEGLDAAGSFDTLHITSHRFDEPRCLEMLTHCDTVVAVHGCSGAGERIMLGGRDAPLVAAFAAALADTGVAVATCGHPYPGRHRRNVCNRGRNGRGVQLELSDGLRGSAREAAVIEALRRVLLRRAAPSAAGARAC